ncbi:hypothetical protein OIU78_023172, partial [Salix suchowensis]
MEIELAVTTT